MKDDISKRKGVPFSTSRSEERTNKHRTHKARRQDGRKVVGGDNGGTWGPTVPGLAPWEPGHSFDHLPDAY